MNPIRFTVAILGASAKEDRYSYQCVELLLKKGHEVLPITPAQKKICNITPISEISAIEKNVDILTLYVNKSRSSTMISDIIKLNPKKIIFNPGAENEELENACKNEGIKTENACTLVLLRTNQFKI
jgi:uncharacterized protein